MSQDESIGEIANLKADDSIGETANLNADDSIGETANLNADDSIGEVANLNAKIEALECDIEKEKSEKKILQDYIQALTSGGVRIYPRASTGYSIIERNDRVVLAPNNPNDARQFWIKDEGYGRGESDPDGKPGFALVNIATGRAIQRPDRNNAFVRLVHFNPNIFDRSILWSQGKDEGNGFTAIRVMTQPGWNMDAHSGDISDGTPLAVWAWLGGHNQQWKFADRFY